MSNARPDSSNGYEALAADFMLKRTASSGAKTVALWSEDFDCTTSLLDLGCGFGADYAKNLLQKNVNYFAVDASPTLLKAFQSRFPQATTQCAAIEDSDFFNRQFDAIIAVGLVFLLQPNMQIYLLQKVAELLEKNGKFLFTAPYQVCEWTDVMTGRTSRSLGTEQYIGILQSKGLTLDAEYTDEGGSHYFAFVKHE